MSDDWIILVPDDPHLIPSQQKQEQAAAYLSRLAPAADSIEPNTSEAVRFVDCGANFLRVQCPNCNAELAVGWWQKMMAKDQAGDGFRLNSYPAPCCGRYLTLNQLKYDWPQAFGRFSIEAMNPSISRLSTSDQQALERILGTDLVVVYQHI